MFTITSIANPEWTLASTILTEIFGPSKSPGEYIHEAAAIVPRPSNWDFGNNHSARQWLNDMGNRGWTVEQINDAIQNGQAISSRNNITPENGATRFVNPDTGRSVIIDNSTSEVIMLGGDNFKYDQLDLPLDPDIPFDPEIPLEP